MFTLLSLCVGCGSSATLSEADVLAIVRPETAPPGKAGWTEYEHDFGSVVGDGQILRREFVLTNTLDRPLDVGKASALTPCCSTIAPIASPVPSGESVSIATALMLGRQSGRRQVDFVLPTNDPARPMIRLRLRATVVPSVAVRPLEGSDQRLPMGQSGRQRFRLVRHGTPARIDSLSIRVATAPPLAASLLDPVAIRGVSESICEWGRDLDVWLPPSREAGFHQGEVRLTWSDGVASEHSIIWEVLPVASSTGETHDISGANP